MFPSKSCWINFYIVITESVLYTFIFVAVVVSIVMNKFLPFSTFLGNQETARWEQSKKTFIEIWVGFSFCFYYHFLAEQYNEYH